MQGKADNSTLSTESRAAARSHARDAGQGAMRIELLWSVGCRRLEVRYVGAARVAVLLDAGELVKLLVLPDRSPPCVDRSP
jgi:hypothetical protein